MEYDVIGDIHGQADKLEHLLISLGYREKGGVFGQPDHQAVFVGDFVDRGPSQLRSVNIVRRMVECGNALAVMGNHEFNAIAWFTADPEAPGTYLRTRAGGLGARNRSQHAAFLAEVEHLPGAYAEVINWFRTLPLWLDLPGFRVVHACWHAGYMAELAPRLTVSHQMTDASIVAAARSGSVEFRTIEGLTKGLEAALPEGYSYVDKDGHERTSQRVAWWDQTGTTYRELAVIEDSVRPTLPDLPIAPDIRPGYDQAKPVFFGHYWMTGEPRLQSPLMACVDYSAAKDGPLVAYRWQGETQLDVRHFARAV